MPLHLTVPCRYAENAFPVWQDAPYLHGERQRQICQYGQPAS